MSPRQEALKRATAVVVWVSDLTDEDIRRKDDVALSYLFGLRRVAQQVVKELEQS